MTVPEAVRLDDEALVAAVGAGVAGLGAAFVLLPGLLGRVWIGADAARPAARVAVRAVGARDLVLGVGILAAHRRQRPVRGWLEATAAVALADVAFTVLAWRHLPWSGRLSGTVPSLAAAATCATLARRTS